MKIITWNCKMAFRKKAEHVLKFKPDILIVPECENPEKLKFKNEIKIAKEIIWIGKNPNKGIGVFSFGNYELKILENHNKDIQNILPIQVTNGEFKFILFAIWAFNNEDIHYNYIGQVWKAIHEYENIIKRNNVMFVGDFNSNVIWDKLKRRANHSNVIEKLKEHNIFSAYHTFYNQVPGKEEHPTFFLYHHENKPYHIDYCFASMYFIEKIESVEIGKYEDWKIHSDHNPLIINFNL